MILESKIKKEKIVHGQDSVVIQKYIAGIKGGRTLNVADWTEKHIPSGTVIIKKSNGDFAPLNYTTADGKNTYVALPEGASYVGVLYGTISKENPAAAIMTAGVVNVNLIPAPLPAGFMPTILASEDISA